MQPFGLHLYLNNETVITIKMKQTLLGIVLMLFVNITLAQENQAPQNYEDSIALAKSIIDTLSISDLTKQKERFLFKTRREPGNKINQEILLYIEEKLKSK